jgi:phosphoglycolate phosphatase-like HAD superfamily hydrolase
MGTQRKAPALVFDLDGTLVDSVYQHVLAWQQALQEEVPNAKPAPDLFLEALRRLGVATTDALVVGDSVLDMLAARRAGALGIGLLSGGYGQEELEKSGAYRVYGDPAGLLNHLDEIGIRHADV